MDARLSYLRVFEDMLAKPLRIEDGVPHAGARRLSIAVLYGFWLRRRLVCADETVGSCARHREE